MNNPLNRLVQEIRSATNLDEARKRVLNYLKRRESKKDPCIHLPQKDGSTRRIYLKFLVYVEAIKGKTILHTIQGMRDKILSSKRLKYFEDILAQWGFIRVRESHLVNNSFVEQVGSRPPSVGLTGGTTIYITPKYKKEALQALTEV